MRSCFSRRLAGFLVSALLLAGCTDREPESRTAFIQYLQAHAGDSPVVLVVPASRDALGEYAEHLAVIEDFQGVLQDNLALIARAGAALRLHRVDDLLARRDAWPSLRADLLRCGPALEEAAALAGKARAGLRQPADLQPLYAAAFDRAVVRPAAEVPGWCAVLQSAVADAVQLAEYVQAHEDQFHAEGEQFQVRDPSVLKAFNALAERLNGHSPAVEAVLAQARSWQAGQG